MQHGLHCVKQTVQAIRDVVDHAIDEEGWSAAHSALPTTCHVLTHALQIDFIVHLGGKTRDIEIEPLGIVVQVLQLEVSLVVEQQIVHRPEFLLPAGALGCLGRAHGVRVNLLQREVPINEAHALRKSLEQQLDCGCGLLAVRAFEVAVFEDCHRRVQRANRVIGWHYRY